MSTTPAAAKAVAAVRAPARWQRITDLSHPAARRIRDVLRGHAANPRVFVLDDSENIVQAIACGIALDSLYVTGAAGADSGPGAVANAIAQPGVEMGPQVPRYILDEAIARALFGGQKAARIFALASAPRRPELADLAGAAGDVVVLDGVRLTGNIGAIARTARALGAAGLVLLDSGLRTPLDRRLIRASRGLVFALPVVLATQASCVEFLRHERLRVATLAADAKEPLGAIARVPDRLALVLGGERGGVSPEWVRLADHHFAIPMTDQVESLNVSVTAGIVLYQRRFRR